MNIKKMLVVGTIMVTEIIAAEGQQHIAQSWYVKLMKYWERLGIHMQLIIQLMLVLLAIYAMVSLFKCSNKCGCVGTGCECSKVEKDVHYLEDNCKCGLDCDTSGPHYKCDVKCECKPACSCSPNCNCNDDSNCACGKECDCGPHCKCGCQNKE